MGLSNNRDSEEWNQFRENFIADRDVCREDLDKMDCAFEAFENLPVEARLWFVSWAVVKGRIEQAELQDTVVKVIDGVRERQNEELTDLQKKAHLN